MLVFLRDTKIKTHLVQEARLWQINTPAFEITGHIKHQSVATPPERAIRVERAVRAAPVGIQHELPHQRGLIALRGVERRMHAARRAAVHGVENMCAQAHGESFNR